MSASDRQLDMLWANSQFYTIPATADGRMTTQDFVYFKWNPRINPSDYTVVVESNDTAGSTFRSIGKLSERLQLPFVKLPYYCRIGVIPNNDRKPLFQGLLVRGGTYFVPQVNSNGVFPLEQYGNIVPPTAN